MIEINGQDAVVKFNRFDLESYDLFLRCKRLPESQLSYDWERDTYTLTTPARFVQLLGVNTAAPRRDSIKIAPHLFDYERFIVERALEARRYAIWADTGLGKTAMFLEFARQTRHLTGGRILILSPLQIIEQTRQEAEKFYGGELPIQRLNSRSELIAWCRTGSETGQAIAICNYEKLIEGQISEFRYLAGLILDESSLLRSGGGTIKWNLIHSAKGIEYKLSCTATPAPNDTMEYASQASFLEKLRTEGEILWTFFTRDKHGSWRVKTHAREAFYRFMASWSIYLRNPAHFGWKDILSTLPPPEIKEYRLDSTDEQKSLAFKQFVANGSGLFGQERMGIRERGKLAQIAKGFIYEGPNRTPRRISSPKPEFVADLVMGHIAKNRQVLVWTTYDEEGAILHNLISDRYDDKSVVALLDGKMKDDQRAEVVARFKAGQIHVLISKPQLLGFGLNFQNCRAMVFSGFDDSFERMYQAIRRAYRYGQTEKVYVDVPYIPELEGMIFDNIKSKEAKFNRDTALQEKYYREAMQAA